MSNKDRKEKLKILSTDNINFEYIQLLRYKYDKIINFTKSYKK
jgi:hypothetical protein